MDEVNLLDDGLVDVVLDSSASGVNTVEREGVGIQHPAKFIMIGSGNPQVSLAILLGPALASFLTSVNNLLRPVPALPPPRRQRRADLIACSVLL